MKKFILKWTETHEAEVEAVDEAAAWELAYALDAEQTLKATTHQRGEEIEEELPYEPDGMYEAKAEREASK